mgnify:CR=1 FL=1
MVKIHTFNSKIRVKNFFKKNLQNPCNMKINA